MDLHEISISHWQSFLNQFSRLHHGREVLIETAGPDGEGRPYVHGMPLLGVMQEQRGQEPQISIAAGDASGNVLGHTVVNPRKIYAAEWNDGTSAELQIHSADGAVVRLRVGPAKQTLPPGFITDGLYERDHP